MSTWHQRRRPSILWHPTLWSLITDPPNEPTSIICFATQDGAEASLEKFPKHSYILPPGGIWPKKENTK